MDEKTAALLERIKNTQGSIPVTRAEMELLQPVLQQLSQSSEPSARTLLRMLAGRLLLTEE